MSDPQDSKALSGTETNMKDTGEMRTRSDSPLYPLVCANHPVSALVDSFLSHNGDWKVDSYFEWRARELYDNPTLSESQPLSLNEIYFKVRPALTTNVRAVSVQANYFRGFLKQDVPIDLSGDLVVIDGRNSSGKTSLAEAVEWLLTGRLARRDQLNAKEMHGYISNRFRPSDEETWVEGVFKADTETLVYRRKLTADYGKTANAY